jgi:multiple sugar transport system ATP-binding protein
MARVVFDHITKRFGDVTAVNDLNIEIQDEEFLVLVGPSGCGKTTALRMLAGLEEVTSGEIFIGDRRVTDLAPKDRDIAMVFQNYALYPHMSVFDNLSFALKLRKYDKPAIQQRVDQAGGMLGLRTLLQRKPRQLSGGQRQRVALGRALVREPQVFLMDEPLSNLDAALRVQTRAEITKLQTRLKVTTVYVTHDQVEAMTMGDRIAVMRDGVLQQLSTPQDLYDHPANIFVAGFIGSPAMNFVAGTLQSQSGNLMLTHDNYSVPLPIDGLTNDVKENLGTRVGKPVVIGVRPEDVLDRAHANSMSGMTGLPATVDVVEPLGSEVLLYLDYGTETPMIVRAEPRTKVKPGDKMEVLFKSDNLHLFDGETELSIL